MKKLDWNAIVLAVLSLGTAIARVVAGRRAEPAPDPSAPPAPPARVPSAPPPQRRDDEITAAQHEAVRREAADQAATSPPPAAPPAPPPPPVVGARVVDRVLTPLPEAALRDALARGHERHFGAPPSPERLACAWAHVAHENGRGSLIYCNNLGNISTGSWPGSYYVIRVPERVQKDPDVWREIDMRFRAHATPEDGAADYWSVMAKRYSAALSLFDEGQAALAALELGERGYYTAHAEPYARGVESLHRHFVARLGEAS